MAGRVEYAADGCYADMAAEKVVVVVGEEPYAEFKGDTDQLGLTDTHRSLIADCDEMGKKVITVLISGRPLLIADELERSDVFIAAWLPGSEAGGVADFLYAVNGFKPTGKTPYSWPRRYRICRSQRTPSAPCSS